MTREETTIYLKFAERNYRRGITGRDRGAHNAVWHRRGIIEARRGHLILPKMEFSSVFHGELRKPQLDVQYAFICDIQRLTNGVIFCLGFDIAYCSAAIEKVEESWEKHKPELKTVVATATESSQKRTDFWSS